LEDQQKTEIFNSNLELGVFQEMTKLNTKTSRKSPLKYIKVYQIYFLTMRDWG